MCPLPFLCAGSDALTFDLTLAGEKEITEIYFPRVFLEYIRLGLLPYGVEEGLGLDWGEEQKGKGGIPWDTPLFVRSLTMTYSHMGKPHTTIGAKSFHF